MHTTFLTYVRPLIYSVGDGERMALKGVLHRSKHRLGHLPSQATLWKLLKIPLDVSFPSHKAELISPAHVFQNFAPDGYQKLGIILLTRLSHKCCCPHSTKGDRRLKNSIKSKPWLHMSE